jgi:tRNA nucleotidyltransferase (CCA-adding enzyme)
MAAMVIGIAARWTAAGRAIMTVVMIKRADDLLARFRALPAAGPLLAVIEDLDAVHLVGGAVRDLILGYENPPDLDLVVEADPGGLVARLSAAGRSHDRFGTSTFELDGFRYDLARARRETYQTPGALPTVAPASLALDLERRDFTVNAASLALTGSGAGTLMAVDGALSDIRGRTLRVLHERSFIDDPTRLLRLARYASRLSFSIEPRTRQLAEVAIAGRALQTVSGPRLGAELRFLVHEPDPVAGMAQLRALGLDTALQSGFGLRGVALARRALELLPADGDRGLLVLATASRNVTASDLGRWLNELAFTAGERNAIMAAAGGARELAGTLASARRPSEVAAAAGPAGLEQVALAGALGPERAAREWLSSLRHVRLQIDGEDLLRAGVMSGPGVGAGLRAALAAKLDGRATDRASELREALRAASVSG